MRVQVGDHLIWKHDGDKGVVTESDDKCFTVVWEVGEDLVESEYSHEDFETHMEFDQPYMNEQKMKELLGVK